MQRPTKLSFGTEMEQKIDDGIVTWEYGPSYNVISSIEFYTLTQVYNHSWVPYCVSLSLLVCLQLHNILQHTFHMIVDIT